VNAFLPLAVLALASAASPDRVGPASPGGAPVVVELFTSEGCSSCPPADALLARLALEGPPGTRVLGLSEHVDYWNGPGWSDPFSSRRFTERQESYARRLGRGTVYTPQAVVDGAVEVLGGDEAALREAILRAARAPRGTLTLRRAPEGVAVEGLWPGGAATVLVALVEDGVSSAVTGGENAGRTLRHVGVVRWLGTAGQGQGAFRGSVALPPTGQGRFRVVAFAQATRTGRILAAGELVYAPGA
jgi:hypothetical protein